MPRQPVDTEPARSLRLRRMAQRQGLTLHKSRTRDPYAHDFGMYWLIDRSGGVVLGRIPGDWDREVATLDDVEAYLRTEGT